MPLTTAQVLTGTTLVARFGDLALWVEAGPDGGGPTLAAVLDAARAVGEGGAGAAELGPRLAAALNQGPSSVPALAAVIADAGGLRVVVHGWGRYYGAGVDMPNGWVDQVVAWTDAAAIGRNTAALRFVEPGSPVNLRAGVVNGDALALFFTPGQSTPAAAPPPVAAVAPAPVPPMPAPTPAAADAWAAPLAAAAPVAAVAAAVAVAVDPWAQAPASVAAPSAAAAQAVDPWNATDAPAPAAPSDPWAAPVSEPTPVMTAPASPGPSSPTPAPPTFAPLEEPAAFEPPASEPAPAWAAPAPVPVAPAPDPWAAPSAATPEAPVDPWAAQPAPQPPQAQAPQAQAAPEAPPVPPSAPAPSGEGRIVSDDGTVVGLQRPIVVGSAPESSPDVASGAASALIMVDPGGAVAPVHATLRIDNGALYLTDAGTPGGTFLLPPGGSSWYPAQPGKPTPLLPGSRLAFGQRTALYER